ncbi:Acetyl esterase/lipase [Monaibacterium marinum]|uniref:Acetyl esterase/lipase n=1 Tax=Pontivivens marinum TaxID=1690039 RepID=A0A2C9CS42_9RHOB|nr:alpha/beta hydrolase [Monaibacterium marinum]SOH94164.1 Acetyl esterase/lipase [Monaibacterium marinum]
MRRTLSFVFALITAGCSPADLLNAVSGSDNVRETKNLSYGPLERHSYDLYEPVAAAPDVPLILYVHGGSWREGSKDIYRFLGTALGDAGYPVAVMNYRLSPETVFPGFVEDAALAADHFLDGDRPVVVMGHSAGAHIASLLAYDPRYMQTLGRSNCDFAGFIGLAGPYEFLPLTDPKHMETFPEETRDQSQPYNFAEGPKPPSLLLHGFADTTVHAEDTELMSAALEAAGNQVDARLYDGVSHIDIISAFSRYGYLRRGAPSFGDVTGWLANLPESNCR